MMYGYIRVSTKEQNEDRQLIAMKEYGVSSPNIFIDKQSGKDFNNITLCLVVPYLTKDIEKYRTDYQNKYDEIILSNIPSNIPKRLYIIKNNQYMVDNSDFIICYVEHNRGGAAMTLEYSQKKNINIIKL